jgi:hypothetical protein
MTSEEIEMRLDRLERTLDSLLAILSPLDGIELDIYSLRSRFHREWKEIQDDK